MAVIYVSPQTDITALIASAEVSPGDVLVLEDGIYHQTVIITKDFLRIVAQGCDAIFDGKNILLDAFILMNVTGVEINGIKITNYQADGIRINEGTANRIIGNIIQDVSNIGIAVYSSSSNLIWKNKVIHAFDGILLRFGSTNNRVVENLVRLCEDDGIESWLLPDENNVFIGNTATNNARFGMEIFGPNNLVLFNVVKDNGSIGVFIAGANIAVINNEIKNNNNSGVLLFTSSPNVFVGGNEVDCSKVFGVDIYSNNGNIQENAITFNKSIGIRLNLTAGSNMIFDNKLICNPPVNILDTSEVNPFFVPDNIILDNIDQPCDCKK